MSNSSDKQTKDMSFDKNDFLKKLLEDGLKNHHLKQHKLKIQNNVNINVNETTNKSDMPVYNKPNFGSYVSER